MILSNLKQYLFNHKAVNLHELTIALRADPDVIRAMLQHWIRKGCIQKRKANEACGGACRKCDPMLTEIYEWIGS